LDKTENIPFEFHGLKPQSKPIKIFVACSIYLADMLIGETKTEDTVYRGGNQPAWAAWFDGVAYKNIPWASIVHIVVYNAPGGNKKPTPLAWVNFRLIDYDNRIKQGKHMLKMWTEKQPNVFGIKILVSLLKILAPCIENYEDRNPPKVGIEIEFLKQHVHYNFNLRMFLYFLLK
jgi:hypothetical protein